MDENYRLQAKTQPYSVHTNFQLYLYLGKTDPKFTSVRTLSGALSNEGSRLKGIIEKYFSISLPKSYIKTDRLENINNFTLQVCFYLDLVQPWLSFTMKNRFYFFVWFDSLHPSQQFFSHVGTSLHGLNQ